MDDSTEEIDFVAQALQRQRTLFEQLSAEPVVQLIGLVDASGVSGGSLAGETLSTMSVGLEAWRIGDGPVQARPLRVRRKVPCDEITHWMQQFGMENIVRLHARVSEENVFGSPQALMEEFVGRAEDRGLREYQRQLLVPIVHNDPILGNLTWSRRYDWFDGSAKWHGGRGWFATRVRVRLSTGTAENLPAALRVAHALWADQSGWDDRVRNYAVEKLLELKNGNWLGEGESPLTAKQFLKRMTLETISVDADGSFDFWHNDGDLFLGHSIQIRGNLTDGPTCADIPG